jgi:hypothetical protein
MDLAHWMKTFRALHERAKRGALQGSEEQEYKAGREELAQPDQSPRQALRVARAIQVELESRVRKEQLATFEISLGGFSAAMARPPAPDEELTATLRLPGTDPFATPVKVVGVKTQAGNVRVSFAFTRLEGAAAERLELAIFDTVLAQLGK